MRELIEQRDCEPFYSPNFNTIEEALSKIKVLLRKAEACTREAMGRALSTARGQDAWGFFDHCEYRLQAQLL